MAYFAIVKVYNFMFMEKQQRDSAVYEIVQNGIVAGLYFGLSMLCTMFPAISQFGPIQCRVSEVMVLLAFFKPRLTIGLTLGCFLTNVTGLAMGLSFPMDIVLGTLATLVDCLVRPTSMHRLHLSSGRQWPHRRGGDLLVLQ